MASVVTLPETKEGLLRGPMSSRRTAGIVLEGNLRTLWYVGIAVFAGQFIVLLLHSWYLWSHFDLTADFGQYSQAWHQIATGHLNPYDTTYPWNYPHYGYPFYQGDLELIMWPMALLYWVWHSAFDLLIVQDVALAGAGLVAFRWAVEHLQTHAANRRLAVVTAACVLAILVIQPWTYWAATYDYHSEPIATLFTLLAGRDVWSGRRRAWVWVGLVLLCGNVGASYVAALGVAAAISGRQRWRIGLVLIMVGAVWLGIVGAVHSGKGAALGAYVYLAGQSTVNDNLGGIFTILKGMVLHSNTVRHVVSSRFGQIYQFPSGVGTIGLFSAVGAALSVVVLAPSALNSSPGFISDVGGAQNIMAVMACAVGIAMLVTWLTRAASRYGRKVSMWATALAVILTGVAVAQTAVVSARLTPKSGQTFERVSPATAAQLAAVAARIPDGAETIVSQGVVGRFAQRPIFYPYLDVYADGQEVPLFGHTVYVVLTPTQGLESESAATTGAAVHLMQKFGARQISSNNGVFAFAWDVPRHRKSVTFPP